MTPTGPNTAPHDDSRSLASTPRSGSALAVGASRSLGLAVNQLIRSYAARHHDDPRTLLLINPEWVKTDLGGLGAQLSLEERATGVVETFQRHAGESGLQFLDHRGQVVP